MPSTSPRTFGGGLLQNLEGANRLKFATVQEAPFLVLKLPDIPSVLVETAYISNPKEEKLLRSDRFQARIAEGIARSVVEFLPPLPPVAVLASGQKVAEQRRDQDRATADGGVIKGDSGRLVENVRGSAAGKPVRQKAAKVLPARERIIFHRVKKGDTLHGIARRYGTSIAVLLELNRLNLNAPLYVDRLLKIPGRSVDVADEKRKAPGMKRTPVKKAGQVVYRVKRGDTLAAIARRHGTTVRVIGDLNRLMPDAPLFVDRTLILPGNSL